MSKKKDKKKKKKADKYSAGLVESIITCIGTDEEIIQNELERLDKMERKAEKKHKKLQKKQKKAYFTTEQAHDEYIKQEEYYDELMTDIQDQREKFSKKASFISFMKTASIILLNCLFVAGNIVLQVLANKDTENQKKKSDRNSEKYRIRIVI